MTMWVRDEKIANFEKVGDFFILRTIIELKREGRKGRRHSRRGKEKEEEGLWEK